MEFWYFRHYFSWLRSNRGGAVESLDRHRRPDGKGQLLVGSSSHDAKDSPIGHIQLPAVKGVVGIPKDSASAATVVRVVAAEAARVKIDPHQSSDCIQGADQAPAVGCAPTGAQIVAGHCGK